MRKLFVLLLLFIVTLILCGCNIKTTNPKLYDGSILVNIIVLDDN